MIEGLSIRPWLQAQASRDAQSVEHLTDCSLCMKRNNTTTRQMMGCGHEPADPRLSSGAWDHVARRGAKLTTCPGYTAKLPEVVEAESLLRKLKLGLRPDRMPEHAERAVLILDNATSAADAWLANPEAV